MQIPLYNSFFKVNHTMAKQLKKLYNFELLSELANELLAVYPLCEKQLFLKKVFDRN